MRLGRMVDAIAATLTRCAAVAAFPRATHFYMLSGDCMPIKTAEHAHAFLDAQDCDYIESLDFHSSDWIKTGFKEERLDLLPLVQRAQTQAPVLCQL